MHLKLDSLAPLVEEHLIYLNGISGSVNWCIRIEKENKDGSEYCVSEILCKHVNDNSIIWYKFPVAENYLQVNFNVAIYIREVQQLFNGILIIQKFQEYNNKFTAKTKK